MDIGEERREITFEPVEIPGSPAPTEAPAPIETPAPAPVEPVREPVGV